MFSKKMKRAFAAPVLAVAGLSALLASEANAGVAGIVDVSLTVGTYGCEVIGSEIGSPEDPTNQYINTFGTLNFGAVRGTWSNALTASLMNAIGTGPLKVLCDVPGGATFTVTVDGGQNVSGGQRYLVDSVYATSPAETHRVPYSLFWEASRGASSEYVIGTPSPSIAAAENVETEVPLYGSIKPHTDATNPKATGSYTDRLIVSIDFDF